MKEIFRSARSVCIAAAYECLINYLFVSNYINTNLIWDYLKIGTDGSLSFQTLLAAGALAYLWGDTHFYWTHRYCIQNGCTKMSIKFTMKALIRIHGVV